MEYYKAAFRFLDKFFGKIESIDGDVLCLLSDMSLDTWRSLDGVPTSADPAQLEDFMDCIKAYGEKESYTAEEAYEILLLFLKQYHDRAPSAEIKDLMDDLLENGHPNGIRFLAYKKYLERGSQ